MATDVSGIASATQQRVNYLNLLIAQMRNQNPLEPLDNNQMASQLAQISQLDQLETLNGSFKSVMSTTQMNYATSLIKDVLAATRWNYASSLIGKTVSFLPNGETTPVSGKATGVVQIDGEPAVYVGAYAVKVSQLFSISQ
jgi:flagellar basal-body rod modification protein FlgD